MVLWPFPQTVKYVQSKKSKAVLLDHETETGRPSYINMLAASFACASLVLGSSLVGSRMLHPLVVGLWVLNVMSPIEHYRMRVKYVVIPDQRLPRESSHRSSAERNNKKEMDN